MFTREDNKIFIYILCQSCSFISHFPGPPGRTARHRHRQLPKLPLRRFTSRVSATRSKATSSSKRCVASDDDGDGKDDGEEVKDQEITGRPMRPFHRLSRSKAENQMQVKHQGDFELCSETLFARLWS